MLREAALVDARAGVLNVEGPDSLIGTGMHDLWASLLRRVPAWAWIVCQRTLTPQQQGLRAMPAKNPKPS